MAHFIEEYMSNYFEEVEPIGFYRSIFPTGELEEKGKQRQGKYNGIAIELLPKEEDKPNSKRYIITDDLEELNTLVNSDNFVIISPISYAGRSRKSDNARFIYAIAIDLDGITNSDYLNDLFYQIDNEVLPRPTYTVFSGNGLHLYYQLDKPVACYKNITKQLKNLKNGLTRRIWNKYTTEDYDKPQIQSLFQGFRIVGGITKQGLRTKAYLTGNKVSIDYLNSFVDKKEQALNLSYKSNLSLAEAKEKYPEWYEKRIVNKEPKGTWECNRNVYDWWKRMLIQYITEGHRYYGLMCLSAYAKKCGINRKELEEDAFGFVEHMEKLTIKDDNHFTRADVLSALEAYNDNSITLPIDTISLITGIKIEKNKRNYRKQKDHIKLMNFIREEVNGNKNWRYKGGRPVKCKAIIEEWQKENPKGTKAQCIKATGITRPTVSKYWNEV